MSSLLLIFMVLLVTAMTVPARSEDVIAPGENLVTEGIPPIPASLAETVGRYTEFRTAGLRSWHPTRREMLIGTRFGETVQIHRVTAPGGARRQITFFRDVAGGGSYQPKHGEYFVFNKGVGGNEFNQNYRYDFDTGAVTLLTDGTSKNSPGVWSRQGDRRAYTSTRRNGKDLDIYVVDPARPETDRMLAALEGGGWAALDWSPDDRRLLVREYLSINESYLWLMDSETGEKTLLTPKGGPEKIAYGGGQFHPDGKRIVVTTDRDSEFRRLAYMDLETGAHTYLTAHIPWDVEDFDLSEDGRTLAFVTNEDGVGALHLMNAATRREKRLPKLPEGSVSGVLWHKNSRDLGFHLTSAKSPTDVYSLDAKTGKVERWTRSETGGLNTSGFVEPERVQWESFDRRMISGFFYRPPERFAGKRPVIVYIHGGPESQFRPTYLGRNNYLLNELGVAILYPNVRGSSGYGKTFLTLDNGFLREDSYRDIETLLDWIRKRPDLDAERIMVMGGSYGGHMTLAVATRYSDRIRCAVDIVGMSHLATFLQNTEDYRRDLRRAEYGDERDPKMRAFLDRIAPLNHAEKITKPLFVIQGANDPRVPLSEAEQMVETLKRVGTPVWYLMARDEGHGFAKKKNADYQFYATVQFIQEYLLNESGR
ncbi:MAG: S9 family peptidase [Armatimonadetes bacterium]|nr:S9 family peptidase [Armatimonadota bacterium]